ncbi:tryptophan synthase subunit alpha [Cohnella sp. CIP 111063]|uniref:tryptophan synthase subunit alpha n=1 Tax=unclassified Cohnella TaxID=2636738 RepID=UPI000B8BCEAE|nr:MULTISPECIES: tryptophan synthase subunit alpha [unclassified Cohnella]OXS61183.1 tryptophan synthase subunit alpha [Cohnella sp. CIP 111063]PRX73743.1 tryptophan synthase alpha chain [Cohnella sp. SGD-V74]
MSATNAIDAVFAKLKASGETALIPFITMGDPDLDTSVALVQAAEEAGAHMVELGVPYSDPLADGPVIQRASERALRNRIGLLDCMAVASKARERGVTMPFILFTYFNPVLQLGLERYFDLLKEHGFSGMIIPDLPLEEDSEVRALAEASGIHLIPLVAPTSEARVERIAARAQGFVYCVSSLGVTGVRSSFHEGIDAFLDSVRRASSVPICVGFGISSREHAERFAGLCDGVIVGSAIVRQVEEALPLLTSGQSSDRERGLQAVRDFIAGLKPRAAV